jgi:hypothetical protein
MDRTSAEWRRLKRVWRDRRLARGICASCTQPACAGLTLCWDCRVKKAAYNQARREAVKRDTHTAG